MKVIFSGRLSCWYCRVRHLMVSVFCFGFLGCAVMPPVSQKQEGLQWPSPPEEARVVWSHEIKNSEDAGIKKTFWQELSDLLFGASAETLGKPYGVFMDDMQRLYVVDSGRAVMQVHDGKRNRSFSVGRSENGGSSFKTPIAVTSDGSGSAFVTDSASGAVFRYLLDEDRLVPFINSGLIRPTGIAYSASKGLLFVADTAAHQIRAYNNAGMLSFTVGRRGDGPGEFNFPTDLFLDAAGLLYVTDALNHRIQVFTDSGRFVREFGAAGDGAGFFAKPKGVAVDSAGNVYVVDALLDAIQIFSPQGEFLLDFGTHGSSPGAFLLPSGIHIDKNDTIYVADSYNRRIQVFRCVRQKPIGLVRLEAE